MRPTIPKLLLVFATFAFGVAAHSLIDSVAKPIIKDTAADHYLGRLLKSTAPDPHHCGYFMVTVDERRRVFLGQEPMGTLSDTSYLRATLEDAFRTREQNPVLQMGYRLSDAVPARYGVDKTLYLKVPRSLSFGELSDLIDTLKSTGADPIGLVRAPDSFTISD